MVEIIKIGNKTLVMDGKILSLFRKGSLLRQMWYGDYEDFDNANGGVWKKYINIPITTIPSEYAQYLIEIDDTNVSVYNVERTLKAQSSIASEFWGLVRSDGFDIRVFDHLFNQLWFWVEEFDYTNKIAKIWVKLPENSEELNIAFGNEKASKSGYENKKQVCEFFGESVSDFDETLNASDATLDGQPVINLNGDPNAHVTKYGDWVNGLLHVKYYFYRDGSYDGVRLAMSLRFKDKDNWVTYGLEDWHQYSSGTPEKFLKKKVAGTATELARITNSYYSTLNQWWDIWFKADGTKLVGYDYNFNSIISADAGSDAVFAGGIRVNTWDSCGVYLKDIYLLKVVDPATFGTPRILEF